MHVYLWLMRKKWNLVWFSIDGRRKNQLAPGCGFFKGKLISMATIFTVQCVTHNTNTLVFLSLLSLRWNGYCTLTFLRSVWDAIESISIYAFVVHVLHVRSDSRWNFSYTVCVSRKQRNQTTEPKQIVVTCHDSGSRTYTLHTFKSNIPNERGAAVLEQWTGGNQFFNGCDGRIFLYTPYTELGLDIGFIGCEFRSNGSECVQSAHGQFFARIFRLRSVSWTGSSIWWHAIRSSRS